MTHTLFSFDFRRISAFVMVAALMLGLAMANLRLAGETTQTASTISQMVPNETAQAMVGAGPGHCGIAVGVIGGVIALGAAGVTLGFGAAFAMSATLHVAAVMCVAA